MARRRRPAAARAPVRQRRRADRLRRPHALRLRRLEQHGLHGASSPPPTARTRRRRTRHRASARSAASSAGSPATPTSAARCPPTSPGARPTRCASRPKHDGGLLGSAELAWDAANGVPLRAAVYARGNDSPVLELKATKISYGAVSASTFDVTPPAGAKIDRGHAPGPPPRPDGGPRPRAAHRPLAPVRPRRAEDARRPPAPRRAPVRFKGHSAALVTYGRGLGGIAVIEQRPREAGHRHRRSVRPPRRPRPACRSRRSRSTAPPATSSTRRSAPSSPSRAEACATRCSGRSRRRRRRPRRVPSDAGGPPSRSAGWPSSTGRSVAVDGVDLTVEAGDVYGYLGPERRGQDDDRCG